MRSAFTQAKYGSQNALDSLDVIADGEEEEAKYEQKGCWRQ